MKKITLLLGMLSIAFLSFAQDPRCPSFYKRNNGNGQGCTAQITLFYANGCPDPSFVLTAVIDENTGQPIAGLTFTASPCDDGKVVICVTGGNIPPTVNLGLVFCNGAGVCYDCFVPQGGPAPVNLSAFYAQRNKSAVTLNWNSETEINSKEYVIQRKIGTDWVDVASVPSANSANGSRYTYSDINNIKGTSQYRLKMVDLDNYYANSDIRAVKGNGVASDFTVFPNPSSGNAKVTVSDISEPTDVQLVDNSGRVLKTISMNNIYSVELPNLQKGMYMIRIVNRNSGESQTKKLTVVN